MPANFYGLPNELQTQIWQEVFHDYPEDMDAQNYPDGPLGCARMKFGIVVSASDGRYAKTSKPPQWLLDILHVDHLLREIVIDLLREISDMDSFDDNFVEKWFESIPTCPKEYYQLYVRHLDFSVWRLVLKR